MSDSSGFRWFVGVALTAAGVVIGYLSLQHQIDQSGDPAPYPTGDPATAIGETTGAGGATPEAGEWVEAGSLQLDLPATFADGNCWTWGIDLDDGGRHESYGEHDEYDDWVDASWYSCRTDTPAIFYGPEDASITTGAGETQDLAACADAIGEHTYLELWLDPADPTTDEGCLYTTEGAFATVRVDSQDTDGTFDTGRITVTFWEWTV
ncbi:hypothetical protein GCM10009830_47630 [Glycomyces endophyticus]|uniref:Uncharacterized protein n=1 Tax=Glycomyces endophyticus TaxID=480996 RepID=A0ABP4TWI7_9ACTN